MSTASKPHDCPAEITLRVIGGRWKIPILFFLCGGTQRFGELRTRLSGVSPKVLTEHLRQMEKDGLVSRTVHAEVPPRVEYALTPRGTTLKPVINEMVKWGKSHAKLMRPGE